MVAEHVVPESVHLAINTAIGALAEQVNNNLNAKVNEIAQDREKFTTAVAEAISTKITEIEAKLVKVEQDAINKANKNVFEYCNNILAKTEDNKKILEEVLKKQNEETDKAAARGALFALENWTWIIFAIIRPSVPPTNLGVI